MPTASPVRPTFESLDADTAADLVTQSTARRDWSGVREALLDGQRLFLAEDQFGPRNVKYLTMAFKRMGEGTLHTRKTTHNGVAGRLVWLGDD